MKHLIILGLMAFSLLSTAQQADELDRMWKDVLAIEKQALQLESANRQLLETVRGRSSKPGDLPYPQMEILLDSIRMKVEVIQTSRRAFATDRDALIAALNGKSKLSKKDPENARFKRLKSDFPALKKSLSADLTDSQRMAAQFDNLKMLYKIDITTYSLYYEQFLKEMESAENRFVAMGSKLGARRAELAEAEKEGDGAQSEALRLKIEELESVMRYAESKITQIQNFQDRLGNTQGDEQIIFGPGVDLPYELKMLNEEMSRLESYFDSFELLNTLE